MNSHFKPGDAPPRYEEIQLSRNSRDVRHFQSSMPWWNPRYWRKRVWGGIVAVVVIVIVIVIAVVVTQSKNNSYPSYTQVSYSLKDTSKSARC